MANLKILVPVAAALLLGVGVFVSQAQDQDSPVDRPLMSVSDPSCTFFGPDRQKFLRNLRPYAMSALTQQVAGGLAPANDVMTGFRAAADVTVEAAAALPSAPGGSRTDTHMRSPATGNNIDKYIFEALNAAGVAPAPATTDAEFVRRAYLDLTGRIPAGDSVLAFMNSSDPDKRTKLVDTLVGSSSWVDKWTIWFGDFLQNNSQNTQETRFPPAVVAFNNFIRTSLETNKKYDVMVREMIGAQGSNGWVQGELNFLVGGFMAGGPMQDVFDAQTAFVADKFLGLSHLNCLLCHNGRGHLDELSLWGYYTSRQQAWGMASLLSHTSTERTLVAAQAPGVPYYWTLRDNLNLTAPGQPGQQIGIRYNFANDYPLNTTTGNRPARATVQIDGQNNNPNTTRVKPKYVFDDAAPASGENYRAFLGKKITADFQFARASVNYMWEYFFGVGLVSPNNQFDPDRLDPDNPPANCPGKTPCTLQPSNARLLNALAQDFVTSGYDLRALQKEIVNSRAYQLSSRYPGTWNPAWQNLFARKLVRRLWSEEMHDAIAQSSNIIPTYPGPITNMGSPYAAWGPVNWAMKFPEPRISPGPGGQNSPASNTYMDAFIRGNRDDEDRKGEGSIAQALALMNDPFVMQRVNSGAATSLIQTALRLPDDQLVNKLYLEVLSRYPTSTELSTALNNLKTNRTAEARNLLWSLYNSVSFVFNY